MDFAKRQLEKYGWMEGQGLGKNSSGIKEALKPSVKLNTFGLGHDAAEEFTYRWWEDAFNCAASNINIKNSQGGVAMKAVESDSVNVSAVKRSQIKRDKMKYGAFLKLETLAEGGSRVIPELSSNTEDVVKTLPKLPVTLSDEQLFEACGRLTAHKAARHGHKLSGKLQRLKEQEEALLLSNRIENKCVQNSNLTQVILTNNENDHSEVTRKRKSKKDKAEKKRKMSDSDVEEDDCLEVTKVSKKKKKEKRKECDSDVDDDDCIEVTKVLRKKKKEKRRECDSDVEDDNCIEVTKVSKKKKKEKRKESDSDVEDNNCIEVIKVSKKEKEKRKESHD